jgi:hypothetical protein
MLLTSVIEVDDDGPTVGQILAETTVLTPLGSVEIHTVVTEFDDGLSEAMASLRRAVAAELVHRG